MKKSLYIISALLINASTLLAQSEKISVKAPGFARPLVEKLVSEYTKQHPDANIEIVKGKTEDAAHTLQFTAEGGDINIARYAVVPVTASGSDAEQLLQSSHLNAKQLRNLLFVKDEFADEEHKESKAEKAVHIYTGNSQQSVARAYASRFNQDATNYKGKKISGDDSFLNIAISRDPLGVTINALSNVDGDDESYGMEWRVTPAVQVYAASNASIWAGVAISGTSLSDADASVMSIQVPVIFRVKM